LGVALSAASTGMRVLLVDADLAQGTLTGAFGLMQSPGISELVSGRANLAHCGHRTDYGIYVIPTGLTNIDATWLFASSKMRSALEEASEKFDLVLIDTPSLESSVDPLLLASNCDAVLMVIRWNSTMRQAAKLAAERLHALQSVPIFAILNKVPRRQK
jgi:succinoglycan biosynthesis transport protein ExoP